MMPTATHPVTSGAYYLHVTKAHSDAIYGKPDSDEAMNHYYGILGVRPDAEDVVIRAAWKALVQR